MIYQETLLKIFSNYLTREGASNKTIKNYLADVADFFSWLSEVIHTAETNEQKFYKEVFKWEIQDIPEMNYVITRTTEVDEKFMPIKSGAINGGMSKLTIVPRKDLSTEAPAEDAEATESETPQTPQQVALSGRPSVRVKDRVYPPAIITINGAKWTPDREMIYSRFVESNGSIVVNPYN